jgi:serine/threonine protein kinase
MGEVYRARDMRLQRDVALKILPEPFAADAERLARFEREARILASLNHPHIAAIHGFEDAGDVSPVGERFLMLKQGAPGQQGPPAQIVVVQNWLDELTRLVPAD